MLTVDFHCHTNTSKDGLTSLEALLAARQRKNIDRLVVTDHNTIQGAWRARQMDPLHIIAGEEIMTRTGELLAVYVSEEVPPGLAPQDAIARLRAQGAFISVSHPFDVLRGGHWDPADLLSILPSIDAVEIFNARCLLPGFNRKSLAFARQHGLPGTVGSDAHTALEIGRATLRLPDFNDAESLRTAIRQGEQQGGLSPFWVHFASTYAKWVKRIRK
jgi:predicted metal-dependent phosphoesterase TrpH